MNNVHYTWFSKFVNTNLCCNTYCYQDNKNICQIFIMKKMDQIENQEHYPLTADLEWSAELILQTVIVDLFINAIIKK